MRVVSKKVGQKAEIIDIENELDALQEAVGGYIECIYGKNDAGNYVVICDEEGRLKGYPANCIIDNVDYCGNIIIAGQKCDEFADIDSEVAKILCDRIISVS